MKLRPIWKASISVRDTWDTCCHTYTRSHRGHKTTVRKNMASVAIGHPLLVYPGRAIGSRASIFTHVPDEWLRECVFIDVSRENRLVLSWPFSWWWTEPPSCGCCSLSSVREKERRSGGAKNEEETNERDLSPVRYVTTILVDFDSHPSFFSDFENRSNAPICQNTRLRDACYISGYIAILQSRLIYYYIRCLLIYYYVINILLNYMLTFELRNKRLLYLKNFYL